MTTYPVSRPLVLSLAKVCFLGLANLPFLRAAPLVSDSRVNLKDDGGASTKDPSLWLYLGTAVLLVLLGGAFAGLTIALMGQDDVNLQVIQASGEEREKRHAGSVLRLLKRGKHWVLVTLLLGNVITNETLPIVLDRSLGGGWPAVLSSTVLIVIFGEIIPQSICVRFGLPIGAWMSPLVLVLMYILSPVAWPTAKLLDWLLGEEQGNVYKKAGLKTLVDLHKTLGTSPDERLNQDEVTIISAVLDLKAKSVGSIMTPMDDVFTMSSDTVLDEKTMDIILSAGYSRIPIYAPDNDQNFVGMLLVKILITYDPEDARKVNDFALATLPETRPETSCLDIVNFFQEGKSHMVLVSDYPGDDHGALGVVTLEDVIEELIGEEIIDESDVFVDVHKAIRRLAPAPKARDPRLHPEHHRAPEERSNLDHGEDKRHPSRPRVNSNDGIANGAGKFRASTAEIGTSPRTTFQIRRHSSTPGTVANSSTAVVMRGNAPEMRDHLKFLGPSNLASRPRTTRYQTVKIKPGGGFAVEDGETLLKPNSSPKPSIEEAKNKWINYGPEGGEGASLLNSAGKDAKDGVQAVQAGYGSIVSPTEDQGRELFGGKGVPKATVLFSTRPQPAGRNESDRSHSTVGSLPDSRARSSRAHQGVARSGSITENVIHAGGVRKVVLETTSSSDDGAESAEKSGGRSECAIAESSNNKSGENSSTKIEMAIAESSTDKKKRRRKKKKTSGKETSTDDRENTPLLDRRE